jgi:DNA anti-recombination protein RmuC
MGFSDDQIHDILEQKEQLAKKIEKHLEEIEKLEKNISVLNTILKQTSFTKA